MKKTLLGWGLAMALFAIGTLSGSYGPHTQPTAVVHPRAICFSQVC